MGNAAVQDQLRAAAPQVDGAALRGEGAPAPAVEGAAPDGTARAGVASTAGPRAGEASTARERGAGSPGGASAAGGPGQVTPAPARPLVVVAGLVPAPLAAYIGAIRDPNAHLSSPEIPRARVANARAAISAGNLELARTELGTGYFENDLEFDRRANEYARTRGAIGPGGEVGYFPFERAFGSHRGTSPFAAIRDLDRSYGTGQNVVEMAIFTHGTPHSLTLGSERGDQGSITQGQSRSISAQLSALLKPGARLNVYACASASTAADRAPGPDGRRDQRAGYLEALTGALGQRIGDVSVFGHATYGHTVDNNTGRTFEAHDGRVTSATNAELVFNDAFVASEVERLRGRVGAGATDEAIAAAIRRVGAWWTGGAQVDTGRHAVDDARGPGSRTPVAIEERQHQQAAFFRRFNGAIAIDPQRALATEREAWRADALTEQRIAAAVAGRRYQIRPPDQRRRR